MLRRRESVGLLALVLALASAASATDLPTLSGFVKDSKGVPQMGAVVEILSAVSDPITAFSDERGYFSVAGLFPGKYSVKVSAASFLPSLRENLVLRDGAHVVVALTLSTLFEAMQLLPPRRGVAQETDDWKWTLRSAANRPILRVLDDGPLVVVSRSEDQDDRVLKARVEFLAGSEGESAIPAEMATGFDIEQSLSAEGTLKMSGSMASGAQEPDGALQATYRNELSNGQSPEISILWRQFASLGEGGRDGFSTMAVKAGNTLQVGDSVEVRVGGEMDLVQSIGTALAYRPSASIVDRVSPNTMVEYGYATAEPVRPARGDSQFLPAVLADSGPRFSLSPSGVVLERSSHQELAVSHRAGANSMQAAIFYDRVRNTAVDGVGNFSAGDPGMFSNVDAGQFRANGGKLSAGGARLVYARKLSREVNGTLDYSYGGVLALNSSAGESLGTAIRNIRQERQSSYSVRLNGELPQSGTQWSSSYGITRADAVTAVDMFNSSPGQADPFWSVFVRQPLPACRLFPGRVEALVDVNNLLAQGYHPVLGADGRTVYLVQSPRSFRGGVAFVF